MDRRDYLDYWAGAKQKIEAFGAQDDREIIFGANTRGHGHEYEILPTVPEADLMAFERETGLTLPLEYRTFLEAYGAGGAGPSYGLRDFRDESFRMDLSTPFPATDDVWGPDEECPEEDPVWKLSGLVYICNHGCGSESLIELNGPDPGRIWTEWAEGILKGQRFFEFYREWFDKTEAALNQYRLLQAIANREPPLDPDRRVTLDDIVGILGADYRTTESKGPDGDPDGNRLLYFGQPSVGAIVLDKDNELVEIRIRGSV